MWEDVAVEQLSCRYLTEEDKREICAWKYDGACEVYNLPSYEKMQTQQMGFMNPKAEKNFLAFLDNDVLVGFVNILEKKDEVFIGIGVNPVLCNRHYGRRMLMLSYEISKRRYPNKPLYLEVRTWHTRAIRCYEKAGFQIDGEPYKLTTGIGSGTFYRMTKK